MHPILGAPAMWLRAASEGTSNPPHDSGGLFHLLTTSPYRTASPVTGPEPQPLWEGQTAATPCITEQRKDVADLTFLPPSSSGQAVLVATSPCTQFVLPSSLAGTVRRCVNTLGAGFQRVGGRDRFLLITCSACTDDATMLPARVVLDYP